MSVQSIEVIREVYRIWQNPAISRLDSTAVVDALNRVYSQRKIEFGLSGGSFLAKVSNPFSINNSTRTANLYDAGVEEHFLQARVEVSPNNSTGYETDWREVKIASYADWETYRSHSELYAAFYGSADSPQILVNHPSQNLVYRLIYEPEGAEVGEESDGLDFPRLFQPLLVYDTAIEAGILIDDDSPEFARKLERNLRVLAMRQMEAHELFRKWLASRKSQSVGTRQAFNDRSGGRGSFRTNVSGIPANLYLIGGTNSKT